MRKYLAITLAALLGASGMWLATPRPVSAQTTFAPVACNSSIPISVTTGTTLLVTANDTNSFIYSCAFVFNSITAGSFSLIEGTGLTCTGGTAAVAGGTTAATGFGLGANGSPISNGGGIGLVLKTKTAGDNLCIIATAGTSNIAGSMSIAQSHF